MNILIKNKNINDKYNIENKTIVGLVLKGYEVKCIKKNKININNSFINIINNEVFLIGSIFELNYKYKNNFISKNRNIKLLLKKKEILFLYNKIKSKNFIIVPISIFININLYIKMNIGIIKKIKHIDKRLIIKKNSWNIKKLNLLKYKNIRG